MAGGFIDISMLGDKKLQATLKRMEMKDQKKILRGALRACAKPALAEIRRLVPVETGKLKKSLKLRARKGGRGSVGVEVRTGTREELGISEDDKYYYPAAVEYGHGKVPAKPYLRAGYDNTELLALGILHREIGERIEQAAKR